MVRGRGPGLGSVLLVVLVLRVGVALAAADLLGGDLLGSATAIHNEHGVSALHREYDKNWRHRVGSAAAEPSADEETLLAEEDGGRAVGAGAAAAAAEDSAFEDAVQPKRRRYNRKRPRPGPGPGANSPDGQDAAVDDDASQPKRRKFARPADEEQDGDGDENRRRKPIQRRRRPDVVGDGVLYDSSSTTTEKVTTTVDLKTLLKQTAGQLSLSELLQNRNLSLADLLKGNRGALSALTASPATERTTNRDLDQDPDEERERERPSANSPPVEPVTERGGFVPSLRPSHPHPSPALPRTTSTTSRVYEDAAEPTTERQNSFVPSKPRRLPPAVKPTASASSFRPTEAPEITTSRPRRLPAVVASRVKAAEAANAAANAAASAAAESVQQVFTSTTTSTEGRFVLPESPKKDALDPSNPEMMAMMSLDAPDTHTSKPRRLPMLPPTPPPPSPPAPAAPGPAQTVKPVAVPSPPAQPPQREETQPPSFPVNVDSLEITTPRLTGASTNGKVWHPPADRIIDAQIFSPGSIPHKFRPHGFVLPTTPDDAKQLLDESITTTPGTRDDPAPASATETFTPAASASPVQPETKLTSLPPSQGQGQGQGASTLQNSSEHFKLENETLDLKEENAVDKRKITPPRPFLKGVLSGGANPGPATDSSANSTAQQHQQQVNELSASKAEDKEKDKEKEKLDKRKQLAGAGTRRLPPTLAGTRRLPAMHRPKTTEPPSTSHGHREEVTTTTERERERPKFIPSAVKLKDTLQPPTRFALPLPEVISIEKMIADAKNRGALKGSTISVGVEKQGQDVDADTTPAVSSTGSPVPFMARDEILDLLKSEQSSARLARILATRNMTLEDLLQHRERGSSQLHFADFFRNATKTEDQPINLVPKEIAPAEKKDSVNILRSFHEVPKYPFAYGGPDTGTDSEEAASTLSLVNVNPSGAVLPAEPERSLSQDQSQEEALNRGPRRYETPAVPFPFPSPSESQSYSIPTFKLPEPSHGSNPYLVIKHVAPDPAVPTPTPRPVPNSMLLELEHIGEIRQIGSLSSSVEDAIVVDSDPRDSDSDQVKDLDPDLHGRLSLPPGVKSAIIASTVICGLAIVGFLTIFIVFRWRQKRALIRARGAILCEQLQRGSFRGRSLSPVLVNVSKSTPTALAAQAQTQGHSVPYYSKKDLNSRATSNTASNRHYYLWRSLRKTFQDDEME